jgi:hypothetical protein
MLNSNPQFTLRNSSSSSEGTNNNNNSNKEQKTEKKQSKFKLLVTQYGPLFIVVHLTTVVLWIYGFFLISKQYSSIINIYILE